MRSSRRSRLIAALVALAAIPAALLAAPGHGAGHGPFGHGGGMMMDRMAERLDLSEEQREQIRAIHERYRDEGADMVAALAEARRQLVDAVHAETYDEAAIRAAARAVGEAESDLAVRRARIVAETREILTPEQADKARLMRELFFDLGRGCRGHGSCGQGR